MIKLTTLLMILTLSVFSIGCGGESPSAPPPVSEPGGGGGAPANTPGTGADTE